MAWATRDDLPPIAGTLRGAILFQFRGDADVAAKVLYEDADSLQQVRLGTDRAFWITGPHAFRAIVDGRLREYRVDGGVLLWQEEDETFRLETALPLAGARAIAETLP